MRPAEGIMIQNTHESILELSENVLFSIILNHNPLDSSNVVNSNDNYYNGKST